MRVIAVSSLQDFWTRRPDAKASLSHWYNITKAAKWSSTNDVQMAFPKAKVLNADRVRFDIAGGEYRLIVAFKFTSRIAFIKFVGTHAEYDKIDALTVSAY